MQELNEAQKKAKLVRINSLQKQILDKEYEQAQLNNAKEQLIKDNKFDMLAEQNHNASIKKIRTEIYDIKEIIKQIENPNRHKQITAQPLPINQKSKSIVTISLFMFCIFLFVYWIFFFEDRHATKPVEKDQDTVWIEEQFSTWNGEHNKLASVAKSHLESPDTYEHIETIYFRNNTKNEITVKTTFIGQNAFGVKQRSCIMAIYSFTGTEKTPPSSC